MWIIIGLLAGLIIGYFLQNPSPIDFTTDNRHDS